MKEKSKEAISKLLGCLLGVFVVGLLIYFGMKWQGKYPWIGSVYKLEGEDKSIRDSAKFKSLEACQNWAQDEVKEQNGGEWDYECGTNCEFDDQSIVGGKRVNTYNCTRVEK